jgi:hypothetical protein
LANWAKLHGSFRRILSPNEIKEYPVFAKPVAKKNQAVAVIRQTPFQTRSNPADDKSGFANRGVGIVQQDRHRPQRYKRQQQQAYYCTVSPYLIGGKALVAKNRFFTVLGSSPKILRWEGLSPNLSPKKIAMWGFVAKHRQGSKT